MKDFLRYHIKDRIKLGWERVHMLSSSQSPLLILTMAKVGSLSVYRSVRKASSMPCFHIHSLDLDEIARVNQECFERGIYPDSRSPSGYINRDLINKGKSYKIISLFRNPIERNISAFFDAFELYVGTSPHMYDGSLDALVEIYHKFLPHRYPIDWYESHFLSGTGINVYDYTFDKLKGHTRFEHGNCSVLLMNSAVDDETKESAIADFLDLPGFKLTNANVTADSKAADLYKDFKSHITFSREYLDTLLTSQFFQHFFPDEEREKALERWSEREH